MVEMDFEDENLLDDGEPIVETCYNPDGFFPDNTDKVSLRSVQTAECVG